MKRRILLVDDEVAVLLTLKAVLEISGYEVETAASGKDAKLKLKKREYAMIITDMRMEHDEAGAQVIQAARSAEYHPAIALLTAFPLDDEDWSAMDTHKVQVLMKPMQTKLLLREIENLLSSHEAKKLAGPPSSKANGAPASQTQNDGEARPTTRVAAKKMSSKAVPAKVAARKAASPPGGGKPGSKAEGRKPALAERAPR